MYNTCLLKNLKTLFFALLSLNTLVLPAQNECYPELPYEDGDLPEVPNCEGYTISIEVGSQTSYPNATTAFPSSSSLNEWNILVNGTFTLNKTMTFTNCKIFFAENAEIVTSGSVSLIGEGTTFTPCDDDTWKGLTINQYGSISLTSCFVDGAEKALNLRKGYIRTSSLLVDNSFSHGNTLAGSTVSIRNCIFSNMRPEPAANGAPTGCGINALKCNLSVLGLDDPGNERVLGFCTFDNCAFAGIKTSRCRLDASYGRFSGRQLHGIHSSNNNASPQKIQYCHFDADADAQKNGIFMERPWGAGIAASDGCNILHNEFTGEAGDGLACIEVRCTNPVGAPMTIADNNIGMDGAESVDDYFYGIIVYGNQSKKINILRNTLGISNSGSNAEFGVFMVNCEGTGHEVSDNSSLGYVTCNYHLEKSRNVKYCSDTSNHAANGFHFYGDNVNTFWSVNDIGSHGKGLLVADIGSKSNGKIGMQTRRGNMWEEDDNLYADKAARCDAAYSESLFLVENQTDNAIFPQKIFPSSGWFNFEPGDLEHCGELGKFVSDFEQRLAAGQVDTTNYSAAELWELKRMLLRTLLDNPSEADDDGPLETSWPLIKTPLPANSPKQSSSLPMRITPTRPPSPNWTTNTATTRICWPILIT